VEFAPGEVTLKGLDPGAKVAWMAMIIEEEHYQEKVRILRGVEIVSSARQATITRSGEKVDQGVWIFADLDGKLKTTAAAPGFTASQRSINVEAIPGATSLIIAGARAEVLYVRNGSAWKYSGADGGRVDADGIADGRIAMALHMLEGLHGSSAAPASVEDGDVILVMDFTKRRSTAIKVGQ
jgi:hypothetical protein